MEPHLRRFDAARDEDAVRRVLSLAFGGTADGLGQYLELVGHKAIRVLDEGERISACLARIDMGQFFGGRSVPMAGIAAVGVAPEARGGGRAIRLMRGCVEELAREAIPLSCLFASTQTLYRQAGFEAAGSRFEVRLPLRQLGDGSRELPIEPVEHTDARVRACYRAFASRFNGQLDRAEFLWKRVKQNRELVTNGFAVVPEGPRGDVEGHVFLGQVRRETGRHDVVITDVAFTSERAGRRILGFLRDYASMGLTLQFAGGPTHPLVLLLSQQWIEVSLRDYWMLRVVDVARAIAGRGYPPGVEVDVVVEIEDELVRSNAGCWRLRIAHGAGEATRADRASPSVRVGPRGLAAIYSGHLSPEHAALVGLASGEPQALRALAPAFAGEAPWMTDHF